MTGRLTLRKLMSTVQPGSYGPVWTWADEAAHLWAIEPDRMRRLVNDIARRGQRQPVMIGDDGRLWDGHHRVVALHHLGRTYINVLRYDQLTDADQIDHLIHAVEDWETER